MDANLAELGQERLELLPDPAREDFAGRVLKARDVIQIMVVETLVQGFEGGLYIGEIPYPAGMRVDGALDMQAYLEGMPMETPALVARRNVGQEVCGFENEFFENFHDNHSRWATVCGGCGAAVYQLDTALPNLAVTGGDRLLARHRPGFEGVAVACQFQAGLFD